MKADKSLQEVLASVTGARIAAPCRRDAGLAVIRGLTTDARRATPDSLFVCLSDRAERDPFESFAAVRRGATAVLCEPGVAVPPQVTRIEVADSRAAFARAAAAFFDHPSRKLPVLGVAAATDGNPGGTRRASTRVAALLTQLLQATGGRPALLSELGCQVGGRELPRSVADLDAFEVQELLEQHRREGGTSCVVELDRVNQADWQRVHFTRRIVPAAPTDVADAFSWRGSRLQLAGRTVFTPLVGPGNAAALRTALAALESAGFRRDTALGCLPSLVAVPGFLEPVFAGQPFGVFVDAARTPAELEELLVEARRLSAGRILLVTGSPAHCPAEVRRAHGEVAAQADLVFATADNPGSECPLALARELVPGHAAGRFVLEPDRHRAIVRALREARPNDLVLLAGKGHRRVQEVAGTVLPFDDRAHARVVLAQRGYGGADL